MTILLLLAACQPAQTGYKGTKISPDYFPLDGVREATYVNEDEAVTWQMSVEKSDLIEQGPDDEEIITFDYWEVEGDLLASIKFSARSSDAIKIHAWSEGADGEYTTFDTPLLLTPDDGYMNRGEAVVTETNGYTFTSTFVETVNCPVMWGPQDWTCVHLTIDDGDGDDTAGPFFAGDWWLVTLYGPAWMQLTGDTGKWNLASFKDE